MYKVIKKFFFSLVFIFCALSTLRAQSNFTVEWESPICYGYINILQYERTNNIPEIILVDENNIKVYDGAVKNLKYTFSNDGSRLTNFTDIWTLYGGFQSLDVNNDGINEFILEKNDYDTFYNDWYTLKVINGSNGQTLYSNTYYNYSGSCWALDIDGDSYLELLVMLHNWDYYSDYSKLIILSTASQVIEVNANSVKVDKYELRQNFPNPFNPFTTIEFSIPKESDVKIVIYNILGQEVKVLAERKYQAGKHRVPFDGSNIASGTYFYQVIVDNIPLTKKMVLLK